MAKTIRVKAPSSGPISPATRSTLARQTRYPLPATWTFKTREGGRGVFQILGSDQDEPKAVRIRYRMLGEGST